MPDNQSIVTGVPELDNVLGKLPLYVEKPIVKNAAKSAMQLIADKAVEYAPKRTNALADAIKVRMGKVMQGGFSVLAAASRKWFTGATFYGAFQEFGWAAGSRKRSVVALATRYRVEFTRRLRAARGTSTVQLARRGSEMRVKQDHMIEQHSMALAQKKGDTRRVIPGKHFVQRAFEETATAALDEFTSEAKSGLEQELSGK